MPRFPYWWKKYGDVAPARYDHASTHAEAFIVDGADATPRRFGWAVALSAAGLAVIPQYGGFWYGVGEAASLDAAVEASKRSVARADTLVAARRRS